MKQTILLILLFLFSIVLNAQTPKGFESRGIGGGGALFSPSINPADHNEIYLSCDLSTLFHSTDNAKSWGLVPFQQIQSGHDSYVSFTQDPLIRYTVDYSSFVGDDQIRPMKSTDGGKTWSVLTGNPYSLNPDGGILRLIADFHHPDRLILADYGTIYYSGNGGNSFTKIHDNISSGAGNHIAGVFFDNNNIYVGTNDGIIFSTNTGSTFSTMNTSGIPSGEYILSFAAGKENGTTRFICLTSTSVYAGIQYGSDYYGELSGIYTMDNVSGNWASKMNGITVGTDYPVFVGMAENDIDTMYCSGGSSTSAPIVMRMLANNPVWVHTFLSNNNQNIYTGWAGTQGDHAWSFPEAPFGFQVCPNDSKTLIFATYSDAYITNDGGTIWKQKYLSEADENAPGLPTPKLKKYHGIGLQNTTNWQVMWSDSNHMFAPFSDISGVTSSDQGKSWSFIPNLTQNSTYRIIKHTNGNLYACVSNKHDIYQTTTIYDNSFSSATGSVYVSTNNGTSFSQIKSFSGAVVWVATDPTNAERLYASVINTDTTKGGIWKTNNLSAGAAATWVKCTNPPRTQGRAFNINVLNNGDLVVSFSARKPTSGTAFTASSGVFYSTNAGGSWLDRTDNKMKYYTKDVVIDPDDPTQSTWYAAVFSAWGSGIPSNSGGLYKTINKGVNWTQISMSYRVNSCTINPSNHSELYFTTETDGLWYTDNIKAANPVFSRVDAYPFRHPMRVFFNPWKPTEMWVSSFGYGMTTGSTVCNLSIPTISMVGDTLKSTPASTYQWYLNGVAINNATNQFYNATKSGNYTVVITDNVGCSATSDVFNFIITKTNDQNEHSPFRIYPNPIISKQELSLIVDQNYIGKTLEIYSVLGNLIFTYTIRNLTEQIQLDLSNGCYYLSIKGAGLYQKLIVQ